MAKRYIRDPNVMWKEIRKLKQFTRQQLLRAIDIDRDDNTVAPFLNKLVAGGYLSLIKPAKSGGRNQSAAIYKLIKDAGFCPRLTTDGKTRPPGARHRMWAAAKVLGSSPFDWRDLSLVAKTTPASTKEYCYFLQWSGYLHIARGGSPGTPTRYLFVRSRDTGPLPPQIRNRRTEVYDANKRTLAWKKGHVRALDAATGKVVWVKGGHHE
jgi:hypothetical protein